MDKYTREGIIKWGIIFFLIYSGLVAYYFCSGQLLSDWLSFSNNFWPKFMYSEGYLFLAIGLFFSIPTAISCSYGLRLLDKTYSKQIFYKMPLYALLPSLILGLLPLIFLSLGGGGGGEMAAYAFVGMIKAIPIGILIALFISFLLSIYYYYTFNCHSRKIYAIWITSVLFFLLLACSLLPPILLKTNSFCNSPFGLIFFGSRQDLVKDICVLENALSNNDYSYCSKLKTNPGNCLINLAVKQANVTICDEIKWDPHYKSLCYSTVYGQQYLCTINECMKKDELVCIDSDGGINLSLKGNTTGMWNDFVTISDYCGIEEKVHEFYCNGTFVVDNDFSCPEGMICDDGACVLKAPPIGKCIDSDGGDDIYTKGLTLSRNEAFIVESVDFCDTFEGVEIQREAVCEGGSSTLINQPCPSGTKCFDGACVKI